MISFFADRRRDPVEQEKLDAAALVVLRPRCATSCAKISARPTPSRSAARQAFPQRGDGHVEISFGAAPGEHQESMTDRVLKEVKRLQQEGPSADLTSRAKERRGASYEDGAEAECVLAAPPAVGKAVRRRTQDMILTRNAGSTR